MGIVLDYEDGQVRPVVVCDWCDQPITDGTRGNFIGSTFGDARPIVFVHTGDCDRSYCAAHGGRGEWQGNDRLDVLPLYLAANLGVDWEAAAARLRDMRDFGL